MSVCTKRVCVCNNELVCKAVRLAFSFQTSAISLPFILIPFWRSPPARFFFFFFSSLFFNTFSSIYYFSFSSTSLCFPLVLNCFCFILFYFILTFMYRCKRVSHTKQAAMVREFLAKLKCKKMRDYNYNYIYLSNIKWVTHI